MAGSASSIEWPSERGTRESLAAQFGDDRADLMGWALTTTDPLADAVVDEVHQHGGSVRVQLNHGMAHGVDSIDGPTPAVEALLRSTETLPGYVDRARLEAGPQAWFTTPLPIHLISLSAGALVRVYASPSIARVLATTGRLIDGADRRILETGKWLTHAVAPGGLLVGGPGYISTIQVRMLHAHMRNVVRTKGFDESAFGAPINQVDLTRTWMDFTRTSFMAEEIMGFGLTVSELDELYRHWWYLAHLLGIDERLVRGLSSNEAAGRVNDMLDAVTGPPARESIELTEMTIAAINTELVEAIHVPGVSGLPVLQALARRFHGDAVADDLGIPRHDVTDSLLTPVVSMIREERAKTRLDADKWQQKIEKAIAAFQKELDTLDGATTYEKAATGNVPGT
jgi:hypothetical protein